VSDYTPVFGARRGPHPSAGGESAGARAIAEYLRGLERPEWAGDGFEPLPCPQGGSCQWAVHPGTGQAYCVKCKRTFGATGEAA
jgi:hypothetical protein